MLDGVLLKVELLQEIASQTCLNLSLLYSRVNLGAPLIWIKSRIPGYSSAAVAGAF